MRACDVESALHRCVVLAKNMYSSSNHVDHIKQLSSLAMIKGVTSMYFEGLCHGLTRLPVEPGRGERMWEEGVRMQEKGAQDVAEAQDLLDNTDGYDPAGNHKLDVSLLGLKRMQQIV